MAAADVNALITGYEMKFTNIPIKNNKEIHMNHISDTILIRNSLDIDRKHFFYCRYKKAHQYDIIKFYNKIINFFSLNLK